MDDVLPESVKPSPDTESPPTCRSGDTTTGFKPMSTAFTAADTAAGELP